MVNRFNEKQITHKLDARPEAGLTESFSYLPNYDSTQIEAVGNADDELISALQNRRENERARQVFEWETVRRQSPPQVYWQV